MWRNGLIKEERVKEAFLKVGFLLLLLLGKQTEKKKN